METRDASRNDTLRSDMTHEVDAYTNAHRQKRRWHTVLSVLAAIVVFITAYALVVPAATMTIDTATLPEGAQVPECYTQIQTARNEDDGFAVTVYAPEGAVPEGATLKADLIAEGTDAYAEAEQAVAASQPEAQSEGGEKDYGFAALDIRFEDAEGNEVEPAGDVYVSIDAAGLLPEDADPDSVTVQHLAEDEAGAVASVDTVADAASESEGVVTAAVTEDANTVQAAFAVDGFSTFTIRYNRNGQLSLQRVDSEGNPVGDSNGSSRDEFSSWTNLVDYGNDIAGIDGWNCVGAAVSNRGFQYRTEITSLRYQSSRWYYRTGNSGNGQRLNNATVYLIYEQSSSGSDGPAVIETADTRSVGVTINLFDYNAYSASGLASQNAGDAAFGNINQGHVLTFDANSGGSPEHVNGNSYVNGYTGGAGGLKQGLIDDVLHGGCPYFDYVGSSAESLSYLFNPSDTGNGVTGVYSDLNHLFTKEGDFYSYDSSGNFATIVPDNDRGNVQSDFTVYAEDNNAGDGISDPKFLPLNEYGTNKYGARYHFGMTVSTSFMMPKDRQVNGKDMVFNFSGDDDAWVFIDGVLVLDLGGIHDTLSGSINFTTGEVKVWVTDTKAEITSARTTIQQRFEAAGKQWDSSDYSVHDFDFFYLERGGSGSNCKIEFNLYTLQKNSIYVGKQLAADEGMPEDVSNYLDNIEYKFRVLDSDTNDLFIQEGTNYEIRSIDGNEHIGDGVVGANGIFTVKAGQYAVFSGIDENSGEYYVQELMDEDYSAQFGDVEVTVAPEGGETGFVEDNGVVIDPVRFDGAISGDLNASDGTGTVIFTNKVDTNKLSSLSIEKDVVPGSQFEDGQEFTVNVIMGGEPVPAGTTYQVFAAGSDSSTTETVATEGQIALGVGERAVFTVLTGTEFTVSETDGADYRATYAAQQQFANSDWYSYADQDDDANAFSGTVGDLRNTDFGDASEPEDGTNASMALTITNSSFDFGTNLQIVKQLEGWTDGMESMTFSFDVVQCNENGVPLAETSEGVETVGAFVTLNEAMADAYAYFNFDNMVENGTYYFLVSENDDSQIPGVVYDDGAYIVTVVVREDETGRTAAVEDLRRLGEAPYEAPATYGEGYAAFFWNSALTSVNIHKVDSAYPDGNGLEGAEFIVSYVDGGQTLYLTEDSETSNKDEAKRFTTNSEGNVTIPSLNRGIEYTLIEVAAPDGYQLPSYVVNVSWESGKLTAVTDPAQGITQPTVDLDSSTITLTNSTGVELPNTGGSGTTLITYGGIALMAVAACGYGLRRCSERGGAKG